MINRTELLVRTRHIGGADATDGHSVIAAIIMRLPFINRLVDRVLANAVALIVFVHQAFAKFGLCTGHREGTSEDRMFDAGSPRCFKAIVHALDVQLEGDMGRQLPNEIG